MSRLVFHPQHALPIRGLLPVECLPANGAWPKEDRESFCVVPKPKEPEPPRNLMPCEIVPCRLSGTLEVKACLEMRSAVWPSGRRKGAPKKRGCVGCALGEGYAARAPWFTPRKASQAAEVLSPAQRSAKARWKAEHEIDDQDWMDPMREAAMLTPDDEGL